MRSIPTAMQTHLDTGCTTLCWCWKVTRTDSTVLGFTDHDVDLTVDSVTYEAVAGFTASEIQESVGLNVDNLDVEGALSSDSLTEDDLAAGLFDGASVELYRVNWADPTQYVLIRKGSIGEVSRKEGLFVAEIRGLAHVLNQKRGRTYQRTCDAILGDSRCSKTITGGTYTGSGTVSSVTATYRFVATGLGSYASSWFDGGKLTWTSGDNNGQVFEVKYHYLDGTDAIIELWTIPSKAVATSDTFSIVAGCDKLFDTCSDKFSNTVNFRGFPHMPGNDYVVRAGETV